MPELKAPKPPPEDELKAPKPPPKGADPKALWPNAGADPKADVEPNAGAPKVGPGFDAAPEAGAVVPNAGLVGVVASLGAGFSSSASGALAMGVEYIMPP